MAASLTREPELGTILKAYHEVTERLKRSHELLTAEVRRLRNELEEKNRELERRERLSALGEMAAGIAHEIRNPLGGIRLYASLLERDLSDRPKQQDIVRKIGAGVMNLENVVGGVLAFAGGAEPQRRSSRLGAILDGVLAQVEPRRIIAGVTVEIDPGLNEVRLNCDGGQIERALANLLFNAIDAVGHDGHVWIRRGRRQPADGFVVLMVEDNGLGIPPGMLQRVFHPFFTTKDAGTGLGLAIVHRIAEAHGGYVTACNRLEGGAVFELVLPQSTATAEAEMREWIGVE